ncbi:MAG: CaiB/BaiF CoA transferase family protein [Acidimicrobiales bacterium]
MVAPLSGVRVLEVANMIAAPGAAAIMADLGASVVKVEPLGGDILRGLVLGPDASPDPWFELDNRGKRGIAVDLSDPDGIGVVHHLATSADVFVTNLTRERQERFQLTADRLHAVAPTLIHTSLTGYGTTGPEAHRLAYDMTAFFARGGIQSLVTEPGGPPAAFRPGQGDHTSSLSILSAVLAALRLRDQTGEGQTVEVALMHVAAWTISSDLTATLATGANPELYERRRWPSPLTCRFRCGDGRWVALCMPGPRDHFAAFARCVGHPEWVDDERYATAEARRDNAEGIVGRCDEVFATAPRHVWAERLDAAELTWAPVQTAEDLIDDPQAEALGILQLVEDHPDGAYLTVSAPFTIRDADVGVRGPAPALGQHGRTVLAESGVDPARIDDLVARGVVADPPAPSRDRKEPQPTSGTGTVAP